MVGMDSGNSLTYSTVEGQGIHFERYSIRPWITRIEQAVNRDRDLFPGDGRGVFCEFDTQNLLRADLKTRFEAYALGLDPQRAFLTANEVRRWERLPRDPAFDNPAAMPAATTEVPADA
jgi:phage portal protein BeeE